MEDHLRKRVRLRINEFKPIHMLQKYQSKIILKKKLRLS